MLTPAWTQFCASLSNIKMHPTFISSFDTHWKWKHESNIKCPLFIEVDHTTLRNVTFWGEIQQLHYLGKPRWQCMLLFIIIELSFKQHESETPIYIWRVHKHLESSFEQSKLPIIDHSVLTLVVSITYQYQWIGIILCTSRESVVLYLHLIRRCWIVNHRKIKQLILVSCP